MAETLTANASPVMDSWPQMKFDPFIKYTLVLVLPGIKLFFFLVDGIVPCFGCRMRTLLTAQWCFGCGWAVLTPRQKLLYVPCSARKQVQGYWEGAWPGQLTWSGQRDIPYLRGSCSIYKLWGMGHEHVLLRSLFSSQGNAKLLCWAVETCNWWYYLCATPFHHQSSGRTWRAVQLPTKQFVFQRTFSP